MIHVIISHLTADGEFKPLYSQESPIAPREGDRLMWEDQSVLYTATVLSVMLRLFRRPTSCTAEVLVSLDRKTLLEENPTKPIWETIPNPIRH